jgi:hypothetical protein
MSGTERLEQHQQAGAGQAGDATDRGADESIAQDIEGLDVVARVDVLRLEGGFVLGDDVQEKILDARRMQIIGDLVRAFERGREVVETTHYTPPIATPARERALIAAKIRRSAIVSACGGRGPVAPEPRSRFSFS